MARMQRKMVPGAGATLQDKKYFVWLERNIEGPGPITKKVRVTAKTVDGAKSKAYKDNPGYSAVKVARA